MTLIQKIQLKLRNPLRPVVRFFMFFVYDTTYIVGDKSRLFIGDMCALANTYFNLSSGCIYVEDNTIFSHNVMVITGRHNFANGKRKSLAEGVTDRTRGGGGGEVPESGNDIRIGSGCWIAAGAIISGGVTIGDNVIIGANSFVNRDIPSNCFAAGNPAKVIKQL